MCRAVGIEPVSANSFAARTSTRMSLFDVSSFFFKSEIGILSGFLPSIKVVLSLSKPTHPFTQGCDVRNVMIAVPGIERDILIERYNSQFRMFESPIEIVSRHGFQKLYPPMVQ